VRVITPTEFAVRVLRRRLELPCVRAAAALVMNSIPEKAGLRFSPNLNGDEKVAGPRRQVAMQPIRRAARPHIIWRVSLAAPSSPPKLSDEDWQIGFYCNWDKASPTREFLCLLDPPPRQILKLAGQPIDRSTNTILNPSRRPQLTQTLPQLRVVIRYLLYPDARGAAILKVVQM
jgi:hypothetical protein